jgi:hypothetical protein
MAPFLEQQRMMRMISPYLLETNVFSLQLFVPCESFSKARPNTQQKETKSGSDSFQGHPVVSHSLVNHSVEQQSFGTGSTAKLHFDLLALTFQALSIKLKLSTSNAIVSTSALFVRFALSFFFHLSRTGYPFTITLNSFFDLHTCSFHHLFCFGLAISLQFKCDSSLDRHSTLS